MRRPGVPSLISDASMVEPASFPSVVIVSWFSEATGAGVVEGLGFALVELLPNPKKTPVFLARVEGEPNGTDRPGFFSDSGIPRKGTLVASSLNGNGGDPNGLTGGVPDPENGVNFDAGGLKVAVPNILDCDANDVGGVPNENEEGFSLEAELLDEGTPKVNEVDAKGTVGCDWEVPLAKREVDVTPTGAKGVLLVSVVDVGF